MASLEEFKVQKDDLMAKFAALEDELKKEQHKHEDTIYELERKQVVDKDRYVSTYVDCYVFDYIECLYDFVFQ